MYLDQNKDEIAKRAASGVWDKLGSKDMKIPSDKDAPRNQFFLVFDLGEVAQLTET
jgi:hypothetical protein